MTDSPALLPRLAHAAVTGVKLLAVGLAALLMAIVATVTTVVGVVTKVLAEVLAQLAALVREALPFLLSIVPVLARAGLILATGASMVLAYPFLWTGYAGDTGSVIVGGAIAAGMGGIVREVGKPAWCHYWHVGCMASGTPGGGRQNVRCVSAPGGFDGE